VKEGVGRAETPRLAMVERRSDLSILKEICGSWYKDSPEEFRYKVVQWRRRRRRRRRRSESCDGRRPLYNI
jgi:hypothetical protein